MLPRLATPLLAAFALAGCAHEPTPDVAMPTPGAFDRHVVGDWPSRDWYHQFGSAELDELVQLAVESNTDLGAARARIVQADARARQAGAALLPSVDANGTANYLAGHSSQGSGHELDWSAMLSASYEVDFWGKNRASAESARLEANAARAERDTIEITTLSGLANAYFQLLGLRERVAIAQANRDSAEKLLAAVQARFDAGATGAVELASQKSVLDSAQIALADLEQAESDALYAISTLLGRSPEGFAVRSTTLEGLNEPRVGAGLPSELLARRPDVSQAEKNLAAAHANLEVARAALLPTLSLTASGGVQNPALPATVLTIPGAGPSLALGANLVQPIFNHGRLAAERDAARARQNELVFNYRSAIVAALTDVENALSAQAHLAQSERFQSENLASSQRAFDGAKLRYEAGSGDYLTLLEAQRTFYAARDQWVQYRLARLKAAVGLCKALGGGWTNT